MHVTISTSNTLLETELEMKLQQSLYDDCKAELQRSRKEISELKQKHGQLEAHNVQLTEDLRTSRASSEGKSVTITRLEASLKDAQVIQKTFIIELPSILDSFERESSFCDLNISCEQMEQLRLQTSTKQVHEDLTSLRQTLKLTKLEVASLQGKVRETETKCEATARTLEGEIAQHDDTRKTLETWKALAQDREGNIENLRIDLEDFSRRLREMTSRAERSESLNVELNASIKHFEAQQQQLLRDLNAERTRATEMQASLQIAQQKIQQVSGDLATTQMDHADVAARCSTVSSELQHLREVESSLQNQLRDRTAAYEAEHASNRILQQQVTSVSASLTTAHTQIKSLTAQLETSQDKVAELDKSLSHSQLEGIRVTRALNEAREQLQETRNRIELLSHTLDDERAEFERMMKSVRPLQDEISVKAQRIGLLEEKVAVQTKESQELQRRIEYLEQRCSTTTGSLSELQSRYNVLLDSAAESSSGLTKTKILLAEAASQVSIAAAHDCVCIQKLTVHV